MTDPSPPALLRIGELSRRLGLSDHVLRAWERRYGLLRPVRTAGGFRLYSEADLERVRRMQAHLARGLSAAQAAQAAIDDERPTRTAPRPTGPDDTAPPDDAAAVGPRDSITDALDSLRLAVDEFDEPTAQAVLDRLFSTLTVESVLREAVLPYLRDLGDRWARGAVSVAQEHFASNVIRGRLTGLARGWGVGRGPRAVLACAPDELHDLALLAFGIVLHRNGWRIDYLGASVPLPDLIRMVERNPPDLVVLAAATPERFDGTLGDLARLAGTAPLAVAGAGAGPDLAAAVGARLLTDDPVTAAERLPRPD
jgi:DNA-binding transcriptional MerR regulator